ncbi:MAG: hypothetical protein WHV64_15480, partial [Geminicoccaceae bacterium]
MSAAAEICFDPEAGLLPLGEVRARLEAAVARASPPPVEIVPLAEARGRILAEPITNPRDVPAFDNVAVDGWAFAAASLAAEGPTRLSILPGRAAAGHPFEGTVPPGHTI